MANWYAVYTRPRCEKKVAEGFLKRKWQSYCPLNKAGRSWPGLKTSSVALFPCYVFVRLEQAQLPEVKKVDGVINLVYWLEKPAVIRDIEIEVLQRFLNVHKQIRLEKTSVDPTAMVKLNEVASREQQDGSETVTLSVAGAKLLLPSLGYILVSVAQFHTYHTINPVPLRQQEQQLLQ